MAGLKLLKSLALHDDKCWSVDVNNGGIMATGSTDRKIKLVDIRSFQIIEELDDTAHKKTVRSVAWRPHSNILAAGSFDSTVSIWGKDDDGYNDENDLETELLAIIEGHENEIKCVAWSHDGELLATCSRDKSVWIWEADEMGEEFECISVLQEHSQDVKHVIWHQSLPLLASSSYDDTVRIWKDCDDDWECCAVLNGHEGTVWSSDFEKSNSNVRLCSGSDDGTVRIWCLEDDNGEYEQEWIQESILPKAHTRAVYSVNWSPKGYIASTGSDGRLVIYKESEDGWIVECIHELTHGVYETNMVKWVEYGSKDVILLITAGDDGHVNVWKFDEN
ncbi:iron-sulfur cluster assembly protein CIA1 [Kluyveromyces lactis]|uniref:Probable cytosolic iron-sulfur protein assembly protein 1 n=1 Tax=Kluyveromyces lactis (strain ATCC 8585 / CBS 2359 / DSM 70799 / NBRC 1267 / NRRL Y-1140 / WM37) TaxID=284590 RepID=CIAO1_KLULA|nr:uncharacterized protein KLLA0_E21781g [Kluyveromyces lactis]Q6CMA2.1 RecName: Full=Probable cytosolic iron-sulfur protein assembly protein 1 [Kluyveromyces lactis NRRL Y-1140]CAH00024.1 KLLA0E21781p [Kluyveromyces lactis]|eukprot:XP_454937.1 uncharacterized protein KLLA0_E21781g [Kluyveromyces lactis]